MGLKSETNRKWSEQELDEKAVWAFQHPHNAKERRKIRNDIADEIEEILSLSHKNYEYMAKKIIENIGGKENIISFQNCITRLRIELKRY